MLNNRTCIKKITTVLLCAILSLSCFSACTQVTAKRFDFYCFGSVSTLVIYDNFGSLSNRQKFDKATDDISAILLNIDNAVSLTITDSDISKFNQAVSGEAVSISKITYDILQICKRAYVDTNGRYDPTVYLCCDLQGLTSRFFTQDNSPTAEYDRRLADYDVSFPQEKYISAFLQLVDFSAVDVANCEGGHTLTKNCPSITVDGQTYSQKMDLGGVAKGYAVDKVLEYLREQGYKYGYFSCGNSSIGFLDNHVEGGVAYTLNIENPRKNAENLVSRDANNYATYKCKNICLSTSGDYNRRRIINGAYYCHIIDASTGKPVNAPGDNVQKGICSLTVFGENSAYIDCLTTALIGDFNFAMDFFNGEKGKALQFAITLFSSESLTLEVVSNIDDLTILHPQTYLKASVTQNGQTTYNGEIMR